MNRNIIIDNNYNDKNNKQLLQVGIIGASYGGLSLANALNNKCRNNYDGKNENKTTIIDYTIFDDVNPTFTCVVGGICVPSGKHVFGKSGLASSWDKMIEKCQSHHNNNNTKNNNHHMVSRKDISNALLENIDPNKVHHGSKITQIVQQFIVSKDQYALFCITNNGKRIGPFDVVVAADGVFSICRWQKNKKNKKKNTDYLLKNVALVGDARWVQDQSFWDFGRTRIQKGADIALNDGIELGQILLNYADAVLCQQQETRQQYTKINKPNHNSMIVDLDLGKFCALRIKKNIEWKQRFSKCIFLLMITLFISYHISIL